MPRAVAHYLPREMAVLGVVEFSAVLRGDRQRHPGRRRLAATARGRRDDASRQHRPGRHAHPRHRRHRPDHRSLPPGSLPRSQAAPGRHRPRRDHHLRRPAVDRPGVAQQPRQRQHSIYGESHRRMVRRDGRDPPGLRLRRQHPVPGPPRPAGRRPRAGRRPECPICGPAAADCSIPSSITAAPCPGRYFASSASGVSWSHPNPRRRLSKPCWIASSAACGSPARPRSRRIISAASIWTR